MVQSSVSVFVSLIFVLGQSEQIRAGQHGRAKRDILDHYRDDHCVDHFAVETKTIIRTKDSRENGAVFINETEVSSLTRCLHLCCSTPLCNVAVYGDESSCYMFDCGSPDAFRCQFTGNAEFTSAVLDVDRHKFDLASADRQRDHSDQLGTLRGGGEDRRPGPPPEEAQQEKTVQDDCGRWQFSCRSGDCIAIYDVCNGIPQCRDGSDEDAASCKLTTAPPPPPTQHPNLRPDMDPPVPENTAFHHRGGLQVSSADYRDPAFMPPQAAQPPAYLGGPPQQQQMGPPLSGDYPYQNMLPQMGGPAFPASSSNMNSFLGNPYSPYVQQFQQQYSSQFAPQYGLQPRLPPLPEQGQQQQPPAQQLPLPAAAPMAGGPAAAAADATSTSTERPTTTRTTRSTTTTTTASLSEVERYEKALIESLGSELQPLEMPGVALFTLIVGVLLTAFIVVVVICRVRRGRVSFRRKLTHDADGDYLVNGMYL